MKGNQEVSPSSPPGLPGKVFFIRDDAVGEASALGYRLMQGLITGLASAAVQPRQLIFVNRGVFLTCTTEPVNVIEPLKQLQARGVEILSCGTCLDHFGLKAALQAGEVGNMAATLATLTTEPGVVTL